MKPFKILALAGLLSVAAMAQAADTLVTVPAEAADPAEYMWHKRPILVFADTPEDPNFVRQIELLGRDPLALEERDVIVVIDSDPAARSAFRQKLRPRGFSLVILDKDGEPELRKPMPWDVREIGAAIDKFPLRRQEMLDRRPAGR